MENQEFLHPEGKIQLMSGTLVDCHPLQQPQAEVDNTFQLDTTGEYLIIGRPKRKSPNKIEQQRIEKEKALRAEISFATNAHFFFDNREQILADSRMFLAPVPVQNGLMYTGTNGFRQPTLGIYLEWWMNCQNSKFNDAHGLWLIYQFGGSPLSGVNTCRAVNEKGELCKTKVRAFIELWPIFWEINTRYDDAKTRYQAYTLDEVVEILSSTRTTPK